MSKAYWIAAYREIRDPERLVAYSKLAGPAIEESGGRFLARSVANIAYEAGQAERTVIIEFSSVDEAVACHDGDAYQQALAVLGDAAVRDMRIVAGV